MTAAEHEIANYLTTLRNALRGLPAPDCDEIVAEIGVHLRESIQAPGANIESVISHLGPARELAAQYRENLLIERAVTAVAPWMVLRAIWRLASMSAAGFACLMLALTGYASGTGIILTSLLKPIFPKQVGLWIGPGVFSFGIHEAGRFDGGAGLLLATGAPAQEVLGWWYIPLGLAIGVGLILGTTKLIRKLVKLTKMKRPDLFLPAARVQPIVSNGLLLQ